MDRGDGKMMESRRGFSDTCRFGFAPVSIPMRVSSQNVMGTKNESDEFDLGWAGKEGSGNQSQGRSRINYKGLILGPLYKAIRQMGESGFKYAAETGIGVIVEVSQIIIIIENPRYPAGRRYIGLLETISDEILVFASDIAVPTDEKVWKAVGRLDQDQGILKIADHSERINDRIE